MSSEMAGALSEALFAIRLPQAARLGGAGHLQEFVKVLRDDRTKQLHRTTTETMVMLETSFFRDARPWEMLRRVILPRLIRQRAGQRRLRLWSAACSTGQEAYSLAMLVCEFHELSDWDVKVLGTDSSAAAIEYARQGRYTGFEVSRGLPAAMCEAYMRREDEAWVVGDRVRAMCEFECGEVEAAPAQQEMFDLVLLRNVLLYFSDRARPEMFRDVSRRMAQDGCLMLGHAEQAEDFTSLFELEMLEECSFYRPVAG